MGEPLVGDAVLTEDVLHAAQGRVADAEPLAGREDRARTHLFAGALEVVFSLGQLQHRFEHLEGVLGELLLDPMFADHGLGDARATVFGVVAIRDHPEDDVAHAHLAGDFRFGAGSHADHLGAVAAMDGRFGPGAELRAVDDHQGTILLVSHTDRLGRRAGEGVEMWTQTARHMADDAVLEDGAGPTVGPVDDIVHQHQRAGIVAGGQTAHGRERHDVGDALPPERRQVGDVVHLVGRGVVVLSVSGHEGHFGTADLHRGEEGVAEMANFVTPESGRSREQRNRSADKTEFEHGRFLGAPL